MIFPLEYERRNTMLIDLVKASRSYRGFDESRRITKEELMSFVDCARFAPSSVNRQPLKFFLAWEKDTVDCIQSMTLWAKALKDIQLPHEGMCPTAFVVICQDKSISPAMNSFHRDVGIVAQTMLLAATEQGLGGCMIGSFKAETVKEKLSLPEALEPMLIVAFGKPAETVVIHEVGPEESVKYYRDENDVHHVPKRRLEDIILGD